MEIIAAFMIGLLGSMHCIGMCGPIALAVPAANTSSARWISVLFYNTGRIFTYGIIGAIFGYVGMGFSLFGWQQILSVICGAVIVIITLTSLLGTNIKITGFFYKSASSIKEMFGKLLQRKSLKSVFMLGLLNGLLPCGLVYIALSGATATGSPLSGISFMIFFGLGTFPAMASIGILKNYINISWRTKIRKFIPVMSVVVGMLLIIRGLNLGIPYLSPKSDIKNCEHHCCH